MEGRRVPIVILATSARRISTTQCRALNGPPPNDISRVSPTLPSAFIPPIRLRLWLFPKVSTTFISVHRHTVLLGLRKAFNMLLISKASTTFVSVCWRIVLLGLWTAFNMPRLALNVCRRIVLLGLRTAFNMPRLALNVSHAPIHSLKLPVKPGPSNLNVPTRMPHL